MCTHIDKSYLRSNPNEIFVFGDNDLRCGYGGAASLRDEPNTYGFITKKAPNNNTESFYGILEYEPVYNAEISRLLCHIVNNREKLYLISKVGAGLANKHGIFEHIIQRTMKENLAGHDNVKFLW